jgi:release factor glutamine methyltransferase
MARAPTDDTTSAGGASAASLSVASALESARRSLPPQDSAALDAQLLLAHALQRPRSWLLAHADATLDSAARAAFAALLARRVAGEPLAYITGRREFWSLVLAVNSAVLVPRPETELLVERALALLHKARARVADLGTGSGAIALALASERPDWQLTAIDQSSAALAVAAANARELGLRNLRWLASDWFAALAGERFDLLVSNPPYIAESDPALLDLALQHEPRAALSSGPEGLDALRAIIAGAAAQLLPEGWVLLEHGATQAAAVATMLVAQGFTHVRCHADLAGLPRVTEAQRT